MQLLPEFTLLRPTTVAEAVQAYARHTDARYLAGGTDLIVNLRRGIVQPGTLIELNAIEEIRGIKEIEGALHIGAGTCLVDLIEDPRLAGAHAVLTDAARLVAGATHREVATLGGNLCLDTRCIYYNQSEWWRSANDYCLKSHDAICHVAPRSRRCFALFVGDTAPGALVLGAKVALTGPEGSRTIPLDDLYQDDGANHLTLLPGEILTTLILPAAPGLRTGYEKIRVRGSLDYALAGVAVALRRDGDNLGELRIAITGTNPRPLLVEGTDLLAGAPLDSVAMDKLLRKQIKPMKTTFSPHVYRRKVASNVARRLARRLWDQA